MKHCFCRERFFFVVVPGAVGMFVCGCGVWFLVPCGASL